MTRVGSQYHSKKKFFLLSDSQAYEFYMLMFLNTVFSIFLLTPPMKMKLTECSETSAYKIKTTGNHPKERTQHSEHGESLISRIF